MGTDEDLPPELAQEVEDAVGRTRPFKIGERCPTLDALESGRAVTP